MGATRVARPDIVEEIKNDQITGNGFNLQNAGDYEISGFEVEATWLPVDSVEVNFPEYL